MKKILTICLALATVISMFPMTASASENNEISDTEKTKIIQQGEVNYNTADGSYTFTLVESTNNANNTRSSITEFTSTTLIIIPVTEEADENLPELINELRAARAGGSNTVYDSDAAGCVSASLTINYSTTTTNGKDYVSLTSISGGYTADGTGSIISGGVLVSSNSITYGASGVTTSGKKVTQSKTYDPGKASRSFSITPPSTWVSVAAESEVAVVGANYTITLKRGTGSWTCYLENNLSF